MTLLEVSYRYRRPPGELEMSAIKEMREVYGIWRIGFDESQHVIRLEYDASRLSEDEVTSLLRNAGLDLIDRMPPAATPPLAA